MALGVDGLNLTRECPICGKKFIPEVDHVYRDKSASDGRFVCTYSCMRESERRAEERRAKTKQSYKRLDPATMTEKQLRGWKKRNSVVCSECHHIKYVERDGVTSIYCAHPDNAMGTRLIATHDGRSGRRKVNRPSWCELRRGEGDGS